MIVGAYAVGVHGRPRATKDLDVWVEATVENPPKVMRALVDFGAPLMGLTIEDLERPEIGLQIGVAPVRVDVLTKISGVSFEEAWPSRIEAEFDEGVRCAVIGLDALLKNKRAAGRPQALADVDALERHRSHSFVETIPCLPVRCSSVTLRSEQIEPALTASVSSSRGVFASDHSMVRGELRLVIPGSQLTKSGESACVFLSSRSCPS